MNTKTVWVLLIALIWGIVSWWWYTCQIKGFCESSAHKLAMHEALDSDNDGLTNVIESNLGLDFKKPDSDLDGIFDGYEVGKPESPQDTDNDGVIDALDADDDDDKIATNDEFVDKNSNGLPDEALDTDKDGVPDYLDAVSNLDTDNDGLLDSQEIALGLDINAMDSDQDGIYDRFEVGNDPNNPLDTDQDGKINALDNDDDNDTLVTENEKADMNHDGDPSDAVDTDGDGVANYLDLDSDNDGLSDKEEATLGLSPLLKDSDNDGIDDQVEIGTDLASPLDQDGDGIIDALDSEDNRLNDLVMISQAERSDVNSSQTDVEADNKPVETIETSEPDQITITLAPDASANTPQQETLSKTKPIVKATIRFPYNSTTPKLSPEAEQYFSQVATILAAIPERRISLIGHTDDAGRESDNKQLGLRRAQVIEQILLDKGVSKKQLDVRSEGESLPIADNTTAEGQQMNRRVELIPATDIELVK